MANQTSKKKKKKSGSDDTIKFLVVLVVAVIAITVIVMLQPKEEDITQTDAQGTPLPSLTAALTEEAPTKSPGEGSSQGTPVPTKASDPAPTLSPTPAPTVPAGETDVPASPTPTLSPTPVPRRISAQEAKEKVAAVIDTSIYRLELLNDHLPIDGKQYYQFCISEDGHDLEPFLIVEQESGAIWCYDFEGNVSEFYRFPLDAVSVPGAGETESAAVEAYRMLCTYSKESLGLAREVSEYHPDYDEELTLVNGVNCYRITLTEEADGKSRNRGEFFISVDGAKCFYMDYNRNVFVPVEKK